MNAFSFDQPQSRLIATISSCADAESSLRNFVQSHWFNHQVHLLFCNFFLISSSRTTQIEITLPRTFKPSISGSQPSDIDAFFASLAFLTNNNDVNNNNRKPSKPLQNFMHYVVEGPLVN